MRVSEARECLPVPSKYDLFWNYIFSFYSQSCCLPWETSRGLCFVRRKKHRRIILLDRCSHRLTQARNYHRRILFPRKPEIIWFVLTKRGKNIVDGPNENIIEISSWLSLLDPFLLYETRNEFFQAIYSVNVRNISSIFRNSDIFYTYFILI